MKPIHANTTLMLTRRLRRLRRSETMRALVRETRLAPDMFVMPLFICEGEGVRREVPSMPGVYNLSVDEAVKEVEGAKGDGIHSVLLFGLPDLKDDIGSAAYDPEAPVQSAIRAIKREVPDALVVTDVCLCEYTDHGHCGIVIDEEIANDPTVDQLVRAAVSHAAAGADIVAPSDMMDGRVGAIRQALDERGFEQTAIMSYAAKYCSAFYGPFRDAAASAPRFGDRRSHQMDPANAEEALREVEQDIEEGADLVLVKPALPYLDVIARVKEAFGYPTAAYHVSGEYSMLKAAARNGWLDERRAMLESLTDSAGRRGRHHHVLRARCRARHCVADLSSRRHEAHEEAPINFRVPSCPSCLRDNRHHSTRTCASRNPVASFPARCGSFPAASTARSAPSMRWAGGRCSSRVPAAHASKTSTAIPSSTT